MTCRTQPTPADLARAYPDTLPVIRPINGNGIANGCLVTLERDDGTRAHTTGSMPADAALAWCHAFQSTLRAQTVPGSSVK